MLNTDKAIFDTSFKKNKPWSLIFIFIFLAIVFVGIGYFFYLYQIKNAENESSNVLKTTAELKADQIYAWHQGKLEEANNIANNELIGNEIESFLEFQQSITLKPAIEKWFNSTIKNNDTRAIYLLNSDGDIILTSPESVTITDTFSINLINKCLKEQKSYLSDFYIDNAGQININLFIPLYHKANPENRFIGAILMKISPEKSLYPLIQIANNFSESSETMLVRKENGFVLFLNELRKLKDAPLRYKVPLSEINNVSVKAVKGDEGTVEGIDYSGANVLSYIKQLPALNWSLVTKIDKEEIYAPVRTRAIYIFISILLIIFSSGTILFVAWKNQQAKYYKKQFEIGLEKQALNAHYEFLTKFANDIILLMNSDLKIVDANEKAISTYGYSRDELFKLNIKDLRAPSTLLDFDQRIRELKTEGGSVFETVHRKKDGELIPVEVSSRLINIGGEIFYQSITRDITERKKSDSELKNRNRLYNLLSKINEEISRGKNEETLIHNILKITVDIGKYKTSLIGYLNNSEQTYKIHQFGMNLNIFKNSEFRIGPNLDLTSPAINAIHTGKYFYSNNVLKQIKNKEFLEEAKRCGFKSAASFPVFIRNQICGLYSVYSEQENFFNETELEVLQRIADNISYSFEKLRNEKINKETEIQLRDSENKFRAVFESAQIAILVLDGEKFIEFNDTAEKLFGLPRNLLLNKKPYDLSPEYQENGSHSRTKALDYINLALSGSTQNFTWQYKKSDGSLFYADVTLNSFYIGDKKYLITLLKEITDKINQEKEIEKNREQINYLKEFYESILENIIDSVWVTDKNDNIIYVNRAMLKIADADYEQMLNKNLYDKDTVDIIKYFKLYYLKAKETLVPVYYDSILLFNSSGKKTYQSGWLIPLTLKGKFNGMICSSQDVTEKIAVLEKIRNLSRAVEQSPASVVITDLNGDIDYANSKFTEITGYTFDEVKGKNPRILKSERTTPEEYKVLWDTITRGEEWHGEFYNKKKNGEYFWEFAIISPIKNDKGEITNYLAVKEDITEDKKIQEELITAKEKAEEMSRLKSSFLANMSHELRTPMSAIMGFAELLGERLEDPELKEMARIILNGGTRLTNTLNSILDLSRIEANKFDVKINTVNLVPLLQENIKLFEAFATGKGLRIETEIKDDKLNVDLDEKLFAQIMNNLLNNSIKFTKEGYIKVSAEIEKYDGTEYVNIKIKDTGIGISPEKLNLIFEPFRQVSEGLNRTYEGTGLGLTLTKRFIESMDGKISLESTLNKGTTFTLKFKKSIKDIKAGKSLPETNNYIPQKKNQVEIMNNDNEKILPKVLMVEDDEISLRAMKIFLKDVCTTDETDNGFMAIELAGKNKYELILMDIGLRGIDGLETAKKIRQIPGYENIPVVAVTAFAMSGDKEEILSSGCSHYISKPFEREEFVGLIKELLTNK